MKKIDFLGNELQVGDDVVFVEPGYRHFLLGKIVKFTEKTVFIEYEKNNYKYSIKQTANQLVKVK